MIWTFVLLPVPWSNKIAISTRKSHDLLCKRMEQETHIPREIYNTHISLPLPLCTYPNLNSQNFLTLTYISTSYSWAKQIRKIRAVFSLGKLPFWPQNAHILILHILTISLGRLRSSNKKQSESEKEERKWHKKETTTQIIFRFLHMAKDPTPQNNDI